MGVFENPILAKGTIAVAQALADTDADVYKRQILKNTHNMNVQNR